MSDENKYASGPAGDSFREPADLKRGLVLPKVTGTPIPTPTNKFWDTFGDDKQPGMVPETKSNPY